MKPVRIAELKARLSEYLRQVRGGESLLVMDRQTPVASLIPYTGSAGPLPTRPPLRKFASLGAVPLPPPLGVTIDVVDLLLEDRQAES